MSAFVIRFQVVNKLDFSRMADDVVDVRGALEFGEDERQIVVRGDVTNLQVAFGMSEGGYRLKCAWRLMPALYSSAVMLALQNLLSSSASIVTGFVVAHTVNEPCNSVISFNCTLICWKWRISSASSLRPSHSCGTMFR